jgi:hypothetical protein
MVRHGKIMCIIVCRVIFPMWMAKLIPFSIVVPTILHCMLCGQFTRVTTTLVSLVFKGSSCAIPYTTFGQNTSWKMFLMSLHLNRSKFFRSHNRISLNIFFMVIHILLKIGKIVIKRLTMGLPFAPNLLVLLL